MLMMLSNVSFTFFILRTFTFNRFTGIKMANEEAECHANNEADKNDFPNWYDDVGFIVNYLEE